MDIKIFYKDGQVIVNWRVQGSTNIVTNAFDTPGQAFAYIATLESML